MATRTNPGWSTRLVSSIRHDLPKTLNEAASQVETEAKRIIYLGRPNHLNRKTGRLQASISTSLSVTDTAATASVGTSLSYARSHELGAVIPHKNGSVSVIPARPFLLPAFSAKKNDVVRAIATRMKTLIRGECR